MPKNIQIETNEKVVVIRIHRPKALNALNFDVLTELLECMKPLDVKPDVGCFVITGSEKAFAAGADIKEMQNLSHIDMFKSDYLKLWEEFANIRTPKIAAVAGYALGGGCELAMMCDIIMAAENAQFGQPEIKLGIIPGMGGTQRLTRLVGYSRAMDMILTGRLMNAEEACKAGLVCEVVSLDELMKVAMEKAGLIASHSKPAVLMAKEAIKRAEETSLSEGLMYERRLFHALFSTEDQKEGMSAFIEKRTPQFKGR